MSSQPSGAEEEPRLPDEVWEKFQNDSWAKIEGSAPREPSARWYEVNERLGARGPSRAGPPRRPARQVLRRPRLPEEPVPRAIAVGLLIVVVAVALSAVAAWVQYGRVF